MKTAKHLRNEYSFVESIVGTFATGSICLWASLLVVSTVFFIFKQRLGLLSTLGAVILTSTFTLWFAQKLSPTKYFLVYLISIIIFLITFLGSLFLSGLVYDLSFDGQAYHQEAIVQLNRGWNPVYMLLETEATANLERWLNHYPKATWIASASIYQLLGNIEYAKVLSIFVPFLAFVFGLWGLAKVRMHILFKVLISLLLTLNPVVLYQSLSFYLDGILVSLLLSLGFVCFRYVQTKDKNLFWPFIFLFSIAVNIKLSAVVFVGIEVLAFILYLWFTDKLRSSLKLVKFSIVGLFLGVVFIGFNPYITNFSVKGHPLYPAMGKGAYDYVPTNTPQNYWKLVPPARLLVSIFSVSSLARGEGRFAELKLPLTIRPGELDSFRETNTKTGGFGPLFSGIFILTAVLVLFYVAFSKTSNLTKFGLILGSGLILGTGGIVATSSVARYVPHVWWVAGYVALFYLLLKNNLAKLAGSILLVFGFVNVGLIAYSYYPYNIAQSKKLEDQLNQLGSKSESIQVDVKQFGSTKLKLKSHNIAFTQVFADSECKSRRSFLVSNISEICEPY